MACDNHEMEPVAEVRTQKLVTHTSSPPFPFPLSHVRVDANGVKKVLRRVVVAISSVYHP